ncbi:MAG: DUF4105 domain-containing protein [Verrucomicrobiota bacterium]
MLPFPVEYYARQKPPWQIWAERFVLFLRFLLLLGMTLWAAGALYYDLPFARWRTPSAWVYGLAMLLLFVFVKNRLRSFLLILAGFAVILTSWLLIHPSNDLIWQGDVDRTARAEFNGDRVTIYNVRNFDYRTETDYTPHWETRTYDLSQLTGVDLFVNYWGSKFMAHPIMSFNFSGGDRLCMSIETRRQVGESYSAIGGIYRQYELIYIAGDERDLVRVRTNYRKGEQIYLYHLRISPEHARLALLDYLKRINELNEHPEFYNAVTSNCTTNIRTQSAHNSPWDWRILLNGFADKMMYDRGDFAGDLPFDELKRRAYINPAAQAADAAPDFSQLIRVGRPGF